MRPSFALSARVLTTPALAMLVLTACGSEPAEPPATGAAAPPPVEAAQAAPVGGLDWAIAGEWRTQAEKTRDPWRNPQATLEFFEIASDETVAEVWPGGGWYTKILGPYLRAGGGRLIAVGFEKEGSEFRANAMQRYEETYVAQPELYGEIEVTKFSEESGPFAKAGGVDTVLTFRNVHNWMAGGYQDKFFRDAYAALKPGGVLGVVEHRLPSSEPQDPGAASGYVHEDYVVSLAEAAGFELVDSSQINANPADTADHPFGVWTLPPVSRTTDRDGAAPDGFDPAPYLAIGESDRMTLKFRKPDGG